jgi:hypothetical protein
MIYSVQKIMSIHNGNTRKAWKDVKSVLRKENPKDSDRLFNRIIKHMQWFYGETGQLDDIVAFYYAEASRRVNNSSSSFWIYGE